MNVYNSRVLELATQIKNIDNQLNNDDNIIFKSTKVSRLCGSKISLEMVFEKDSDVVKDFVIDPKACALGQASAAILSQRLIGARADEIINARDNLRKMLKENGKPPEDRFGDLRYLEAVADYAPRHASVLLAWEAACDIVEQHKNTAKQAATDINQ